MPFKKGQSGNPGGRPKALRQVEELARLHTVEAVKTLAAIHSDTKTPPAARVAAANALLDRGWGEGPAGFRDGSTRLSRIANAKN